MHPAPPCRACRNTEDGETNTGVAPEQFFDRDRKGQSGCIRQHGVRHEVETVQTDLGGLFHDRPRELFALVPFLGGGPHNVRGEVVDPVFELLLFFVQRQRKFGHGYS